MDLVMPLTVPVKVGLATGAFKLRASCVAIETGLLASAVLSTLPSPTMDFMMPLTVPVKVGLANGAFVSRDACKPLTSLISIPAILLPNTAAPLNTAGPLSTVVPVKTAFVESALRPSSSTLFSTELILDESI